MTAIKNTLVSADLVGDTVPENLSGVKTFDPKTDKPLDILQSYTTKDFLGCSCGANRQHKTGLVVRFDNGYCGLIGKNCAEEYFGAEFAILVKNKEAKDRTAIYKSLIAPRLEEIGSVRSRIKKIRPIIEAKDVFFSELCMASPKIYEELEVSRKHQGYFHGAKKDYQVDGYDAISTNGKSKMLLVENFLNTAEDCLKKEPYADDSIASALRYMERIRGKMKEIEEEFGACPRFFSIQNLSTICTAVEECFWLNDNAALSKNKRNLRIFSRTKCGFDDKNIYIEIPSFTP